MMDDLYTNNTDYFSDTDNSSYTDTSFEPVVYGVEDIITFTGLPLALLAIVAVFILARKDHGTPVFIINLLISDVIQLCSLAAWRTDKHFLMCYYIYSFGLSASLGFMVCISLERYLVITKPLWYRLRRDIRITAMVCVGVWTLPLLYVLPFHFIVYFRHLSDAVIAILLLLPLPLFIFFLFGTLKALSAALSVPDDEKRRIVAILVAVLLIYILLFLPFIIWGIVDKNRNTIFHHVTVTCIRISPLADLTLYFFIRKGVIDTLLKPLCCKMSNRQETRRTENDITPGSRTEAV